MSLAPGVPRFTTDDAVRCIAHHFGIIGSATVLPSERDQNFLVHASDGARFVLKVAHAETSRDLLEAEQMVMQLAATTGRAPHTIRTTAGDLLALDGRHFVRVISACEGQTLGRTRLRTDALLRDLGASLARLDNALLLADHPALHRHFHWDLAHALDVIDQHADGVTDPILRRSIDTLAQYHRTTVVPLLPTFRRSVIHGDANDYNVLVDPAQQSITGIIDFGDVVYSHTVNDVAIAMAYVALGADDPLAAAAQVAAGYHETLPLTEDEMAALFSLMCMRLCVSACLAVTQQAERPDVAYLGISQGPIARVLPMLASTHPRFAHYTLRSACGLAPVPFAPRVESWLATHASQFAPLVGHDLRTANVAPIDLSVGGTLLSSNAADNPPHVVDQRVRRVLSEYNAEVGAGGYDEARVMYEFANHLTAAERRTIHMGLDLSMPAGTPLYAPLDGVVHGFEFANQHHDYGPVIVLRHETTDDAPSTFYTLYGHLSVDSLDGLVIGQSITRGQEFARIGSAPTNGDWWEHVHVQLIMDMLDVPCNVDGAVRASQRAVWRSICPDPNLLFGIPATSLPQHPNTKAIAAARQSSIGGNLSVSYGSQPLQIVRGWKQYLFDETGRRYIDGYNNVAHVGHAHPRVVRAVSDQLAVLNTNTRYLQDQLTAYAQALTALLPESLSVCYFTASGSEANELALRLARAHTGQRDLIVMESAYHGHTTTLIDISPYKHNGPGGVGAPDWVHTSPIPDVYRRRDVVGNAGHFFASEVGQVIERIATQGRGLCGYIAETCPSVGGQIMMPDGFLADVYARVRAAGGVCIADEVQTGFGRIGTHFWAFEQQHVIPDIVVLGKPIANGYPMGAVITTSAIADSFNNGMEYFSTFGGSTAACVAAHATLRVTLDETLQANALTVGSALLNGLRSFTQAFEIVGDIRGSGLFIGVELVRSQESREPHAAAASWIVQRMRALGVLAGTDGPHHNVIKLRGPMTLSIEDAARVLDTMQRALLEYTNAPPA